MSEHLCDTCAPDKPNCGLSECDHKPRKQTNFERVTRSPERLIEYLSGVSPYADDALLDRELAWLNQEAVVGDAV